MYIDMASSNYGTFNLRFATLVGLETAVYFEELLHILSKVKTKKAYDEFGYFKLDRTYVTARTTLKVSVQRECDKVLKRIGLLDLSKQDNDLIRIDAKAYIELVVNDTVDCSAVKKIASGKAKAEYVEDKKNATVTVARSWITEKDPLLIKLYEDWVESVYESKRFLTKAKVKLFIDSVNKFTNSQDVKVELLTIAISTGYDTFEWVGQKYISAHPNTATSKGVEQCKELAEGVSF